MEKKYLFLIILFIRINSIIINNPGYLGDNLYPFLLSHSDNDYNYIITSGNIIKIKVDSGNKVSQGEELNMITYSSNDIFISDKVNNNFLYLLNNNNKYYNITYESNIHFKE